MNIIANLFKCMRSAACTDLFLTIHSFRPCHQCLPHLIYSQADPKWLFFWRIGERPPQTEFNHLNAPQVIPAAFPDWSVKMDAWGNLMLAACETAAEMAAHGFHLPANAFTNMMKVRACMFSSRSHICCSCAHAFIPTSVA